MNFQTNRNLKIKPKFTVGTEAANAINVAIQLYDRDNGNEVDERVGLAWYLASNATGDAIATATTGGIAIGTDGLLLEWTNNVSGWVVSEVDGDIDVTITDSGTPTMYLVLVAPDGKVYVSGAITFA